MNSVIHAFHAPLVWAYIFSSAAALAQTARDERQRNPAIPLVDSQSIAVARLDLTKIDPDALERSLRDYVADLQPRQIAAELAERNIRNLATRLRRLKELKVHRPIWVLTLYGVKAQYDVLLKDPENHMYVLAAVPDGADPLAIARVFAEDPPVGRVTRVDKDSAGNPRVWRAAGPPESTWLALHFHSAVHLKDRNVVIAGSPDVLEYVISQKVTQRGSVASALAAAGDGPFQLAVAPPAVFGRAMQETLGPIKLGDLSVGNTLAEGFQWAAFGLVQHDSQLAARLVIQSRSAAGAQQMQKLIALGFAAAAEESKKPDAKNGKSDSPLAEFGKLINLQADGDQLLWQIDRQHTPPEKVAAALRPVLSGQQIRLGLQRSINNMRAIGLALHNFYDVYKAFPTPATYDKDGKPLLSWRVHILPYVEEGQLYREFHRDEPWDSEHNKKLITRMPAVYRRPFGDPKTTKTPYQLPIGDKTVFQFGKKSTFGNVRDGTSKTIGVVEVDPDLEVIWTKPDDWEVDWSDPTKGLASGPGRTFVACFLDIAVYSFPKSIDKEVLRRFLMADDGYPVHRPEVYAE
jgi:hypothetical protein